MVKGLFGLGGPGAGLVRWVRASGSRGEAGEEVEAHREGCGSTEAAALADDRRLDRRSERVPVRSDMAWKVAK